MDTSDLKNQLDADKVSAFLKTEAFYLAVVIFVAVTAMSSTFVRFTHEYADGPGRTIINQKELYLNFYNTLSGLIRDKRAAAIFPVAVIVFKAIMLLLGVITTIGVAATWVVNHSEAISGHNFGKLLAGSVVHPTPVRYRRTTQLGSPGQPGLSPASRAKQAPISPDTASLSHLPLLRGSRSAIPRPPLGR